MSLVYWLPLRTDLRECGSKSADISSTNSTFENQSLKSGLVTGYIDGGTIRTTNRAFTISFWMRTSGTTSNEVIRIGTDSSSCMTIIEGSATTFKLWYNGTTLVSLNFNSTNDGKWHNYVVRCFKSATTGSTIYNHYELWYDGVKSTVTQTSLNSDVGSYTGTIPIKIDNTKNSNLYIKDIKIWDEILSTTAIYENLFSSDMYLNFGPSRDISGNNIKCSYTGSRYNTTRTKPKYGKVTPDADATESYLKNRYYDQQMAWTCKLSGSSNLDTISILAEIELNGAKSSNYNRLFGIETSSFWFGINMENYNMWLYMSGTYYRANVTALDDGSGQHTVGLTYEKGTVYFWCDGVKITPTTSGQSAKTTVGTSFSNVYIDAQTLYSSWTPVNNFRTSCIKVAFHKVPDKYFTSFGKRESVGLISEMKPMKPGPAIEMYGSGEVFAESFRNNYGSGAGTKYDTLAYGPLALSNTFSELMYLDDGSCWVPLIYQKCDDSTSKNLFNPAKLTQSASVELYTNEECWSRFNIMCGIAMPAVFVAQSRNYEFLLYQQADNNAMSTYRWTQDAHPFVAKSASDVGSGKYTTISGLIGGGIYRSNIGCILVMAGPQTGIYGIGQTSYDSSLKYQVAAGISCSSFIQVLYVRVDPTLITGTCYCFGSYPTSKGMYHKQFIEIS